MPILYKNAKKEVDKDFNKLIAEGWTPTANEDGVSYSWVNDKGEKRRGAFSTGNQGIDVDAGAADYLKRGRRQRRLMSEKVTALLPMEGKAVSKSSDKDDKTTSSGATTTGTKSEVVIPGPGPGSNSESEFVDETYQVKDFGFDPTLNIRPTIPTKASPTQPKWKEVKDVAPEKGKDMDISSPYIYMTEEEAQEAFPKGGLSRLWHRPWESKDQFDVAAAKAGRVESPIGMQMVGTDLARRKTNEGGEVVKLYENPNFIPRTAQTEEDAKALSQNMTSLFSRTPRETVFVPATKTIPAHWKVEKNAKDVVGNVSTAAQSLLIPNPTSPALIELNALSKLKAFNPSKVKAATKVAEKAAEVVAGAAKRSKLYTIKPGVRTAKQAAEAAKRSKLYTITPGVRTAKSQLPAVIQNTSKFARLAPKVSTATSASAAPIPMGQGLDNAANAANSFWSVFNKSTGIKPLSMGAGRLGPGFKSGGILTLKERGR